MYSLKRRDCFSWSTCLSYCNVHESHSSDIVNKSNFLVLLFFRHLPCLMIIWTSPRIWGRLRYQVSILGRNFSAVAMELMKLVVRLPLTVNSATARTMRKHSWNIHHCQYRFNGTLQHRQLLEHLRHLRLRRRSILLPSWRLCQLNQLRRLRTGGRNPNISTAVSAQNGFTPKQPITIIKSATSKQLWSAKDAAPLPELIAPSDDTTSIIIAPSENLFAMSSLTVVEWSLW